MQADEPAGRVLVIAGSDSGGGAGIQADIKAISAMGGYAATAITAITVQNTLGVSAIHPVPNAIVEGQIRAVLDDIGADVVKTGMLATVEIVELVAAALEAADPALRKTMAGLVIAALSGDDSMILQDNERVALAAAGGTALMSAAPGMAELQGRLGETQARIDETQIRLTGERDALNLARNNLIGADPYEAAGQLEVVQTRLETLYAVTARTSRLNLTEYL